MLNSYNESCEGGGADIGVEKQIDTLLITPPFTQLNTPYPATPMLKGTLEHEGYVVSQQDLGIETINTLLSKSVLSTIFDTVTLTLNDPEKVKSIKDSEINRYRRVAALRDEYISTIDPVIKFLKGADNTIAQHICNGMLPSSGNIVVSDEELEILFGLSGVTDRAKYIATRYIEEIGDIITKFIDPHFGFSRYAESISSQSAEANRVLSHLDDNSLITDIYLKHLADRVKRDRPKLIGFTVPFPGNLLSAIKCSQYIKLNFPEIKVAMGGGFVNTEFRSISDKNLFNFIDYLLFDDGERPLIQLIKAINGDISEDNLVRTMKLESGELVYKNNPNIPDLKHSELSTPDYRGLPLESYISVLETANPMHRLWSDGRWNKMIMAHGCYWAKCSFCDISLDYIKRYSATSATSLCDQIEKIIEDTGCRGFHFTDEAAPPKIIKELSLELIKRGVKISWWTNIRFEKSFTTDLAKLMAKSGCIAVSGGLEVASERLLKLINKGVTLPQIANTTKSLKSAGIMIHAYLMYGFPTESEQETIDSLEVVRQLFKHNLIDSAYWHRFAMTVHSPIGLDPDKFKVQREEISTGSFALNDCAHHDPLGADHSLYGEGLRRAIYNYMHQNCIDNPLQEWFNIKVPKPKTRPDFIANALLEGDSVIAELNSEKIALWLHPTPIELSRNKKKITLLFIINGANTFELTLKKEEALWLLTVIPQCTITESSRYSVKSILNSYEEALSTPQEMLFCSKLWSKIREYFIYI